MTGSLCIVPRRRLSVPIDIKRQTTDSGPKQKVYQISLCTEWLHTFVTELDFTGISEYIGNKKWLKVARHMLTANQTYAHEQQLH